jgi:hypothetical protein
MAQWIRRLTTNQEIPGSTPGSLNFFTHLKKCGAWSLQSCLIAFSEDIFISNRLFFGIINKYILLMSLSIPGNMF